MGLLSKLFVKKEATKASQEIVPFADEEEKIIKWNQQMLQQMLEVLKDKTGKWSFEVKLNTRTVSLAECKFGGLPYLPKDGSVPEDYQGRQLRLLAQFALAELPDNSIGLPKEGILQFWALDDDLTGLDLSGGSVAKGGHKVVYYPEIDDTVTEEEIKQKYNPYVEDESFFPIQNEFAIDFIPTMESISGMDCSFDKTFTKLWNETYPDKEIDSFDDLGEAFTELFLEELSGGGHKLGGYPMFTQEDPRIEDSEQMLLLQIDSYGVGEQEIMWGDSGVANFFITEKELKALDFTNVLYNWDCY